MDILWQGRMRLEDEDADPAKTYTPIYSDNPHTELLVLGAVSLCLTLVNIISIFLAGIIVLKVSLHNKHTSLLVYMAENLVQIYVTYQDH
jgi:hypothetical protein